MNTNRTLCFAKLLVFALATIHAHHSLGQPQSRNSSNIVADSVAEFSSAQGQHGWQYGYWNRSSDADGEYNQSFDFRRLKSFGKDPRNGLSGHSAFNLGEVWLLEDGRFYTSLWAKGGHPNSSQKLGGYEAAEQWPVRRWVSDTSGVVTISGNAGKVMPWGANWGGACRAIIVVDGKTVLSTVMDEQGIDYSVAVKIRRKSIIDFLIAPDPSVGVVTFTAKLHRRPTN
ncbi:MAG: hypothetical protein ACE361_20255 [Aureliella sp.]